jgi:Domain of Unknown Function (DUF1206)
VFNARRAVQVALRRNRLARLAVVTGMSIQAPGKPAAVHEAQRAGSKVGQSTAFEALARAGFVARAVIYGTIGILAIKVALGAGGKTASQTGALKTIAHQPFGKVLLILVAIGLAGYALWRFIHVLIGHGPEKSDDKFERLAALGSGVTYALICAIAVSILLGSGSSSSGSPKKPTAGVLGWPAGTWIVGLAGVVLCGVALYQLYRGLTQDFLKDSKTEEMSPAVRKWITWIGTFGHLARTVVFGLVGIFLIKAAVEYDPNKAVGLDGALAKLANHSYGEWLLGIVAAGLIAFAIYSLSDARYRRI